MKVGKRGQITIPIELRQRHGLKPLTEVEVVEENYRLVLRKKRSGCGIERFAGILRGGGKRTDSLIEELRGR